MKANDATHNCTFDSVANGEYAVTIIHDENSNGKLDTNFMGIPKEGVGASNNILHKMGPPEFLESKFKVDGAAINLSINMGY